MRNLSLKWLIFTFYFIFGYLPLMIISFVITSAYSRSVESITEDRMLGLVRQVSDQTSMFYENLCLDLKLLSGFSGAGAALATPVGQRNLGALHASLRAFKDEERLVDELSLYGRDGQLIISTAAPQPEAGLPTASLAAPPPGSGPYYLRQTRPEEPWEYDIILTLFEAGEQGTPAGFLLARVGLDRFTVFLARADVGHGVERLILDERGEVLWRRKAAPIPKQTVLQKTREYSAVVGVLGWRMVVRVPESVLLGDINRLVVKNLIVTGLVALLAAIAAFEFSRRTSNHLKRILQGARVFASGDLEHRIEMKYGSETRALAHEFNLMAQRLNERQSELVQANKLASLGLLSAGIAHEIKNPLAGIKTSAQVLQDVARGSDAPAGGGNTSTGDMTAEDRRLMEELAESVGAEVDRLTNILNNLLDFARPLPSRQISCRLDTIVDRALSLLEGEIRKKRIQVEMYMEPFTVDIDPDQMLQVMINLLLNAVWAVEPEQGRISLSTSRNGENRLVLVVADNGIGIPPEAMDRIFDPFFSLNNNGTGLGLSVVYSLLAQNHVHIKADSQPNNGTSFRLTFGNSGRQGNENDT